jgi:cytoskeleton protein RodZ
MMKDDLFSELRSAREARGMSLDDISRQTLINVNFLQAIESGDTGILPAAYVRAFLRAYASSVGLDPAYVMRRFEGRKEPAETPPPPRPVMDAAPEDAEEAPAPPFWSRSGVRTWGVTLVVLLGIAIIVYLTQLPTQNSQPEEIQMSAILHDTERRLAPEDTTEAAGVPQAGNARDSLTLRATTMDSVWVQIAIDALPPVDYLFPPQNHRQWRARERFTVTLGNAGGVQFHLNARDLGTLGKRGAVLRNIEITREALTSPVQAETHP